MRRLIALITINRAQLAAFRAFENHAARTMRKHGGEIERAYELVGDDTTLRELHVVRFPDDGAFAAYRADPEITTRERAGVIATEIWPAIELPSYPTT